MKKGKTLTVMLILVCIGTLILPPSGYPQGTQGTSAFKPEELGQLVAPIALYPDSLVAQILMASTYPLEIVQAARWANQNKNLKGDALAKALEKQTWDPSVKSLVNFPQVLQMMNDRLDWTQKLGDAVLAQQGAVMDAIQDLRAKANAQGTLKSTPEQKVVVQEKVIVIEPTNPNYVYVPTYNPTVVYGAWPYPAYPPAYYYPPGYVAGAAFAFTAGVALTAAWGYAWGNCNWGHHEVNYNVNQNINRNTTINREAYQNKAANAQGKWQHNPENRKGVAYRDQNTAQKYNRAGSAQGVQDRQAYRGKGGQGPGPGVSTQPAGGRGQGAAGDRGQGPGVSTQPAGGRGQAGADRSGRQGPSTMDNRGQQTAFGGMDKGSNTRMDSDRGSASRQSMASTRGSDTSRGGGGGGSSMSRGGGGGGGGVSRGGGGGGGGGMSRGGGGGGGGRRR